MTQNTEPANFNALIDTLSLQGYVICDDFLAANTITALYDEAYKRHTNNDMVPAKTGLINKSQQSNIRGDHIFWLDANSENINTQAYLSKMQALKAALNQQLFMNLQSLETHFTMYPIGGFYQKHLDQFNQGIHSAHDTKARQLSSILYLNADWQADDGGELRLYLNEHEHLNILPTAGKLVLFLSQKFWHEVRPAKRERISLTGWFRTRSQSLL
ncbi:2OG-Fe(II) oxygenase [Methylotenera versatilis]|uniref:2OG-Fe(II) oxygenase n=1 Tax=Methylotenera versatilis TaxID=1055487 RepID=UPI000A548860|nr:2OG-Fe(II) oxygenase [Methylotenera versatilis]